MLATQLSNDHGAPAQLVGAQGCCGLFGLDQSQEQLAATADGIIAEARGPSMVMSASVAGAMAVLDKSSAKRLGQILIAKGVDADTVADGFKDAFPTASSVSTVWKVIATASAAASAYHGYKRNDSIGWAIWWMFMGGVFPIITPVIAVAQGFGKPK